MNEEQMREAFERYMGANYCFTMRSESEAWPMWQASWQAALSTMPRISEGELVALVQNVLAPKRQNSESMRGQSVAVARAILAKLPHLKEQQ